MELSSTPIDLICVNEDVEDKMCNEASGALPPAGGTSSQEA